MEVRNEIPNLVRTYVVLAREPTISTVLVKSDTRTYCKRSFAVQFLKKLWQKLDLELFSYHAIYLHHLWETG